MSLSGITMSNGSLIVTGDIVCSGVVRTNYIAMSGGINNIVPGSTRHGVYSVNSTPLITTQDYIFYFGESLSSVDLQRGTIKANRIVNNQPFVGSIGGQSVLNL